MKELDQYYQILAVKRDATLAQVKQSYRKLAKQWHPDRFINNPEESLIAAAKFQEIHEAYQVIKLRLESTPTSSTSSAKVKKTTPNFYYDLGVIAAEDNDWQEALEYFSLAIKLNPKYWQAYIYRATVLERQGFEYRAESDWQKAQELKLEQTVSTPKNSSHPKSPLLWQYQTTLKGHFASVNTIAIAPDGKLAVSGSSDYTIGIWNLVRGNLITKIKGHSNIIHSVAISPNGNILATASADKTIKIWNLKQRTLEYNIGDWFSGHRDEVFSLCFTPNSQYLVSSSADKTVRFWDLATRKEVHKYSLYADKVLVVNCNAQGNLVATSGLDGWIKILSSQTGKLSKSIQTDVLVTTVAFSPSANILASAGFDRQIKLWNLSQKGIIKTPVRILIGHTETISDLAFTSIGNQLISGSWDGSVKIWNMSNGKLVWTLKPNIQEIDAVAISKNGQTILAGGRNSHLVIFKKNVKMSS